MTIKNEVKLDLTSLITIVLFTFICGVLAGKRTEMERNEVTSDPAHLESYDRDGLVTYIQELEHKVSWLKAENYLLIEDVAEEMAVARVATNVALKNER